MMIAAEGLAGFAAAAFATDAISQFLVVGRSDAGFARIGSGTVRRICEKDRSTVIAPRSRSV
jgi:hypothetical protein